MNIKTLNVSLLSISIITALFPLNAMATKLTIEQRLELLENELSQNWSSRLLMTWMRFSKKECAKLYVRCANTLNPVSTGFLISLY